MNKDLDIRANVPAGFNPGNLIEKRGPGGYKLTVNEEGKLEFNGASSGKAPLDGWLRVTYEESKGEAKFYTSPSPVTRVRVKKAPWYAPWDNLEEYDDYKWEDIT